MNERTKEKAAEEAVTRAMREEQYLVYKLKRQLE